MNAAVAIAVWLAVVVASIAIVVYLARRWGHDPFGWTLLAAAMGPIAILALVGTRQTDAARRSARVAQAQDSIVLACDGSPFGPRLAQHVVDHRGGARDVIVLTVLPHELRSDYESGDADATGRVDTATDPTLGVLHRHGIPARVAVRFGVPGEEIVRYADEVDAALILVGRRGSGLTRALLGSASEYVVGRASRPVVIVS